MKNQKQKIELELPIRIVPTADNNGLIIKDANNIEHFFYNQKDSDEMEYDGWSADVKEDNAKSLADKLREHLDSMSEDEIEEIRQKYFTDNRPKGWLSIEEHLPMMKAIDITQGYSVFKVCNTYGFEHESKVSDHNTWYHHAKEIGITHWLNE